jgi:RNA polymerase sigma factor for flagellar operon FliA
MVPERTPTPERPGGCVARRRDAYYAAIATRGNLTTRLNLTTTHGMPHPLSHTA